MVKVWEMWSITGEGKRPDHVRWEEGRCGRECLAQYWGSVRKSMRALRARDVGLAVGSNVVARERRSVMMSERRVVKDGVEGEGGVPSVRHPGQ